MDNSYRFFENRECKSFPCHKGLENFNCLFCYCPLYHMEKCLGNPSYKEIHGRIVKVCTNCSFPHDPEHYDDILKKIKENW